MLLCLVCRLQNEFSLSDKGFHPFDKIAPSKPLRHSVKVSEFKQSIASHATSFDGEPSRLKLIEDISVLFALL